MPILFDQLSSQRSLSFATPADGTSYTLTGVALLRYLDDERPGSDWLRQSVDFDVFIPGFSEPDFGLKIDQWALLVTLNSISNDHEAINAGWAVDDFEIVFPEVVRNWVTVRAHLAVRDIDGYILRLGYQIHLLGRSHLIG